MGAAEIITFTEVDGRTELKDRRGVHTQEVARRVIDSGRKADARAMDRLEEVAVSLAEDAARRHVSGTTGRVRWSCVRATLRRNR